MKYIIEYKEYKKGSYSYFISDEDQLDIDSEKDAIKKEYKKRKNKLPLPYDAITKVDNGQYTEEPINLNGTWGIGL